MSIRHMIEPDGDWGLKPKSGPYNSTESEWTGVMGSVVNGNYHISMTQWIMNPPRWNIMEHLFSYGDRPVLAVVNKPPDIDSRLQDLRFFTQKIHDFRE